MWRGVAQEEEEQQTIPRNSSSLKVFSATDIWVGERRRARATQAGPWCGWNLKCSTFGLGQEMEGRGCERRKFVEESKDVRRKSGNWGNREERIMSGKWVGEVGREEKKRLQFYASIVMKEMKANDYLCDICLKKIVLEN
jgi:hypothetical protein